MHSSISRVILPTLGGSACPERFPFASEADVA
jgi:hypothetical protein